MDKNTVAYIKAEKRVKEVKSFYKVLFVMISISCFLMMMNFVTDRHEFWSIYPVMGLSLVVAFKYARVFGWPGFGKEWEEKQFYQELERIQEREERIRQMLNKEKLNNLAGELWKGAKKLRGKFKAYEYQAVILPMRY